MMREKLLAIGDDFEIKKASHRRGGRTGHTAYYVDAKALRVRDTIKLREGSRHGKVLYKIQERKLRIRDAMTIEDDDGRKIAELKKRNKEMKARSRRKVLNQFSPFLAEEVVWELDKKWIVRVPCFSLVADRLTSPVPPTVTNNTASHDS